MPKQHPQTAYRKYAAQYGFVASGARWTSTALSMRSGKQAAASSWGVPAASDRYTPQDSLALTRLMYDIRMSWGMKFVGEV